MGRHAVVLLISIVLSSCASFQKPRTLDQVKASLACVEYTEGVEWRRISESLGSVDVAPLPEPGSNLQSNTRVYKNKWVIFSVENQEFNENGKTRFREIAKKIEVCVEK